MLRGEGLCADGDEVVRVRVHWELVVERSVLKVNVLGVVRVDLHHLGADGGRQNQAHRVLHACSRLRVDAVERSHFDLEGGKGFAHVLIVVGVEHHGIGFKSLSCL